MSFTKLDSGIIHSSIWQEDSDTKVVWITLLAMVDAVGIVNASIPGIAKAAGVSLEKCVQAIELFKKPDVWSKSKAEEGRRVLETDKGFLLVTYDEYRKRRDPEERREQVREAVKRHREKNKASNHDVINVITGNQRKPRKPKKAHVEEEGEAEEENTSSAKAPEEGSSPPKEAPAVEETKPRDAIFDVIATECGINLGEINKTNGGMIAKAKKDIRESSPGVTPEEIKTRANNYRRQWPGASLTPTALSKHWASLGMSQPQLSILPSNQNLMDISQTL